MREAKRNRGADPLDDPRRRASARNILVCLFPPFSPLCPSLLFPVGWRELPGPQRSSSRQASGYDDGHKSLAIKRHGSVVKRHEQGSWRREKADGRVGQAVSQKAIRQGLGMGQRKRGT